MFSGHPFSKGLSREVIRQGDNLVIFFCLSPMKGTVQYSSLMEVWIAFSAKNNVGIHRIQVCGYCTRLFSCVVDQFMNGREISCKEIIKRKSLFRDYQRKALLENGSVK